VPIPPVLRNLYRSFNGFRGPTGAAFFWPLFGDRGLVRWHQFLRSEFTQPWLSTCLFYGDAGGGSPWGLKADLPGRVILWDAEWGDDFEVVRTSVLDVWLDEKRKYDELL
jgi:hypothetical protein